MIPVTLNRSMLLVNSFEQYLMIGCKSFWSFSDAQKAFQSLVRWWGHKGPKRTKGSSNLHQIISEIENSVFRKLERGSYLNHKDKTRSPYHLSVQQRSVWNSDFEWPSPRDVHCTLSYGPLSFAMKLRFGQKGQKKSLRTATVMLFRDWRWNEVFNYLRLAAEENEPLVCVSSLLDLECSFLYCWFLCATASKFFRLCLKVK